MNPLIEQHREELIALCVENEIKGLWLFGSAATGEWDAERSDLDFLFDIGDYDSTAGRRSMRLFSGLERMFGENIDIISRPAIRRPDFRASIDKTAVPIYER